jgi:hypothetical protein
MRNRSKLIVVGVALATVVVSFGLPLFTYSSSYYGISDPIWNKWDAQVSASYFVFNCGSVRDVHLTTWAFGNDSWTYSKTYPGLMFVCFYHPTQNLRGL